MRAQTAYAQKLHNSYTSGNVGSESKGRKLSYTRNETCTGALEQRTSIRSQKDLGTQEEM
jgi:hypothetical protein